MSMSSGVWSAVAEIATAAASSTTLAAAVEAVAEATAASHVKVLRDP